MTIGFAFSSRNINAQIEDSTFVNGQKLNNEVGTLSAINKSKDKDILLRWLPTSAGLWLNSLKGYYTIEKAEFKEAIDFDPNSFVMIEKRLEPWTEEKILEIFENTKDSSLLIAGQCLYGPWESIDTSKNMDIKGMYERYQELTNRYGIAAFSADRYAIVAEAMALRYVDKKAKTENSVIYRVCLFVDSLLVAQTTTVFDGFTDLNKRPVIKNGLEEESKIVLTWDREIHEKNYTSYWIEHSIDNRLYERLHSLPYVHAEDVTQSLGSADISWILAVENYKPRYYRIIGVDPFGDDSEPSEALLLMGRDRTAPPVPDNVRAYMQSETSMTIQWSQDTIVGDLKGYYIMYAKERDGIYILLSDTLPVETNQFIDYFPNYFGQNYYLVCAIDTADNVACSFPTYGFIQDTVPPSKPIGLKGVIDSSGVVTLHWPLGLERDIMGYNVYFSNRYDGVFSIITNEPIRDTIFKDTINLNSLSKELFYRISAVDVRSNTSDFSDMVLVMRPDTIPPGAAVFTTHKVLENGIYLQWVPSGHRDVISHRLYRKKGDAQFEMLTEFKDSNKREYLDTLVDGSTIYIYRILAVDDAGLISKSVEDIRVKSSDKQYLPIISLDIEQKENVLTIEYRLSEGNKNIKRIILMKSIGEGPFLTWKTIENPDFNPINDWIDVGKNQSYKAMAITNSGQKTKYSPVKTIGYGME